MDGFSDLPELLGAVPTEPRDLFYWVKMFCVFIHWQSISYPYSVGGCWIFEWANRICGWEWQYGCARGLRRTQGFSVRGVAVHSNWPCVRGLSRLKTTYSAGYAVGPVLLLSWFGFLKIGKIWKSFGHWRCRLLRFGPMWALACGGLQGNGSR